MIKRVQAASAPQGCQIGLFDANLTNLTFLETVGVKQLFGFFSSIYGFFGAVGTSYQTCVLAF